jgi:Ser-tRNA(Ala) deacylase AlaX
VNPDRKLFYEDPSLSRWRTRVVATGEESARPWVRLEATIFYPEGGGQPPDRGTIGGIDVVDVQSRGDRILHFLSRAAEADREVDVEIDAGLRFERSQQHTAQHLLTAILADRYGLPTTSFHLGEISSAIEVAGPVPSRARLDALEDEVNAEIRADRAVRSRWVSRDNLAVLDVRTRGLPEGHEGPVRLVEIEGVDLNTCGGTHIARLAEIQILHILDAESARGGARIRFLAGGRVARELRRARSLEEALKERIGTAPQEFASVIDTWQSVRKGLEKRASQLERRLAEFEAVEIAAQAGERLQRVLESATPDYLRFLAAGVLARRPEAVVVLFSRDDDGGEASLLVQSGPEGPEDVSGLGASLCAALGARGGGRGRRYQARGGQWHPQQLPVDADGQ